MIDRASSNLNGLVPAERITPEALRIETVLADIGYSPTSTGGGCLAYERDDINRETGNRDGWEMLVDDDAYVPLTFNQPVGWVRYDRDGGPVESREFPTVHHFLLNEQMLDKGLSGIGTEELAVFAESGQECLDMLDDWQARLGLDVSAVLAFHKEKPTA